VEYSVLLITAPDTADDGTAAPGADADGDVETDADADGRAVGVLTSAADDFFAGFVAPVALGELLPFRSKPR
jgi:hypothetical protein